MQDGITWSATSRHELERAKKLLNEAKVREGKRKAHKVDGYWLCLPVSYTPEQVEKAIKKHKRVRTSKWTSSPTTKTNAFS